MSRKLLSIPNKAPGLLLRPFTQSSCHFERHKSDQFKADDSSKSDQAGFKTKYEDPFARTGKILKSDMKMLGYKIRKLAGFEKEISHDLKMQFFPTSTDVLIIGGGAMGSSIAYWLKQRAPHALNVMVIEKDPTYAVAATTLSVGGLRQQFSLPENIQMSLYGAEFLRDVDKTLAVDGHPKPNVQFQPYGYLTLAGAEGAEMLKNNSTLQCQLGARNILLSANQLKERFPWLNTDGIELGCLGVEKEGWFDPWSLLNAFKRKSINLGAEYVEAEVVGFEFVDCSEISAPSSNGNYEKLERVVIKMPSGEIKAIKFAICILAAGPQSGEIARMARIGQQDGLLSVPLPVEPKKRYVYVFHAPDGPGLNTPLLFDPTGMYFRREGLGGNYIGGISPTDEEEPPTDNLDVDYNFFNEKLWPILAHRVPTFENLKLKSAWAGFYEYNYIDANGIVGLHPYYHNLYLACGFSGHGIQHSPAVGRAIMELILDGEYKTIDLSRLGYERLCLGEPLVESVIY